ncbi:MAG TPA: ABC transporter ATP-binding protein, partial [Candidatus Saccharibacteria bacterium]|nr:ABC transporter ATP-binding protein [Candidatus Saccharibacteria bacterium]
SFGDLLVFMTYMGYLLNPVQELVSQVTSRNKKLIDVHRVYEVLSDHEGIENLRKDSLLPPRLSGIVRFENVSYSYKDNLVLNNVNFTVNAGEKIGIIGPSGGGKSTILKLVPLFIEPDGGRVLIDEYDTQTVSLHDLRKRIAWVSQTPQLFDGTILDNLYDADIDRQITSDEVVDALDVANVTEFAVKLPLGLDTPTGENGGSLSGGQRQRVAIARSLLRGSPIICLDEPTAALDAKSENYIKDSLSQMIQGKTVMMVTHRKALLALMDTIYVLENSTLTNVNELGGLDAYLAKLEGLEIENAQIDNEHIEPIAPIGGGSGGVPEVTDVDKAINDALATVDDTPPIATNNDETLNDTVPTETTDNDGTLRIDHHQ